MIDFEENEGLEGSLGIDSARPVDGHSSDRLWVNRYRPATLDRFCLDERLKNKFRNQIDSNDIQNVCLVGSPGIGKTTLALILANSVKDSNVLFIGCAGGQGKVETISSDIVPFCQSASRGLKVVILDELDSASATQANSFQKALRNVIERFQDCRFIATCNYQTNVISPILSRLPPVSISFSVSDMINNLIYIMGEENVKVTSEPPKVRQFLGNLIKSFYPDMRLVLGHLQAACVGGTLDVDEVSIDNADVLRTTLDSLLSKIGSTGTPLELRKMYNNEVLSFGSNGNLAELCSPLGLATALFNHIIGKTGAKCDDLMELADLIYKIEHVADGETQLFAFLLKVKSMGV